MTEYTLKLRNASDYRMIKKLLKAFDGASITPVRKKRSHLDVAVEEAKSGKLTGPYNSVKDLMTDLMS